MTDPRERALELLEQFIASGRENDHDPAATARECLLALEGIGYQPTPGHWKLRGTASTRASDLPQSKTTAEALAAVREQCAASPTRVHPAEKPDQVA